MLVSINPYTGKEIEKFEEISSEKLEEKLQNATSGFVKWRKTTFEERTKLVKNLAEELRKNKQNYAKTMTQEMGKPISQAIAEIEKCAWVCEYYAENAVHQLADEEIETDAEQSYITYEPLGPVLAIMPWNYPFWQVFRFAAPALMAGNIGVLKHASNVMGCAENIEKAFRNAGFPDYCFQNLLMKSKDVETVIRDKRIKAVTLTGSAAAGSSVAATAGSEIKKTVLELGGSNALVVFEDADLDQAVETCVQARFQNTGQSCIAGKRLLLQESIAEEFLEKFKNKVTDLKSGDPSDEASFIGVMAREDLAEKLEKQVEDSVKMGATILCGGTRKAAYFEPCILKNISPEMPIFKEETFGPAIGVLNFKTEEEAVDLVNKSQFGLGVSIFTKSKEKAKQVIPQFEDGAVFVNEMVKSDPRLPFGGTKNSGYGRELSYYGIREFINIKTVYFS